MRMMSQSDSHSGPSSMQSLVWVTSQTNATISHYLTYRTARYRLMLAIAAILGLMEHSNSRIQLIVILAPAAPAAGGSP